MRISDVLTSRSAPDRATKSRRIHRFHITWFQSVVVQNFGIRPTRSTPPAQPILFCVLANATVVISQRGAGAPTAIRVHQRECVYSSAFAANAGETPSIRSDRNLALITWNRTVALRRNIYRDSPSGLQDKMTIKWCNDLGPCTRVVFCSVGEGAGGAQSEFFTSKRPMTLRSAKAGFFWGSVSRARGIYFANFFFNSWNNWELLRGHIKT